MDLKQRTLRGLVTIYLFKLLWMMINFVRSVVVARLLFPEDFAIVALAFTFIYFVEQLFSFGFSKVLIQKKDITDPEIQTAFTLNLFQNIIFFIILFVGAPIFAAFYNKPIIELVVRLLACEVLFQIIGFIPKVILQKQLKFKEMEMVNFVGGLVNVIVTIWLALIGFSFWSIVIGSLVGNLIRSIAYMSLSDIKARLVLVPSIVRQYFKVGLVIYGAAFMTYCNTALETTIVGKLSGLAILGYYTVARDWAKYFHVNFFQYITHVLFPSYAMINDNRKRFKDAVLQTVRYIMPIIVPIYIGFYIVAPEFIVGVLGNKWTEAIAPFRLLLISFIFISCNSFLEPLSDAVGKFEIKLKTSSIRLIMMITFFPLMGFWKGITGYCMALIIIGASLLLYNYWLICVRILSYTWHEFLLVVIKPVIAGIFMSVVLVVLGPTIRCVISNNIIILFFKTILGTTLYIGSLLLFDRGLLSGYLSLMYHTIKKEQHA